MGRVAPLRAAFVAGLAVASMLGSGSPALAAPPEASPNPSEAQSPSPSEDQTKAAAKAEVLAGSTAFSAGEYAVAIAHYQAAIALLPAPKLHYNIAVCHQRLALAAEDANVRTRERELAVESYNHYLEQNPQAEDRLEVAETIRELNGTPVTMPALKPLFETDSNSDLDVVVPDSTDPPPEPQTGPGTEPSPDALERPYPDHGRFGFMLVGGFSPDLRAAKAIDAPGMFALEFHGGGFVGRRRRFLIAAETMLYAGATLRPDGLSFYGYSLGLLGEQTWVVGHEAVQIGFGGVAALTGQGLNQRQQAAPPLCSLDRGTQVAGRTGGLFAPRLDLGLLIGSRRRGMISLLVQPSVAVFGDGPGGAQCIADQTPWTVLGVERRWQFQLWAGAGFSFRF